jgi:hypothetical protein
MLHIQSWFLNLPIMTGRNGDEVGHGHLDLSTFTPLGRAPYQGPRRRELASTDVERFRRWLAAELRLSNRAAIEVAEWVAFDSRETPHTTMIAVRDGHRHVEFTVAKELCEVARLDLPLAAFEPRDSVERGTALAARRA